MTYNKPEVVKLAGAVDAIQGNPKGNIATDSQPEGHPNLGTVAAYESDE
jgi:hypothetical protein